MIYDSLQQHACYHALGDTLQAAFVALTQLSQKPFDPTRQELPGGGFVFGTEYDTKTLEASVMEAHRNFIDVMLVMEGQETAYWMPTQEVTVTKPYDPAGDALIGTTDGALQPMTLCPGRFVVFFPQDAHCPGCNPVDGSTHVKKYIAKVPVTL